MKKYAVFAISAQKEKKITKNPFNSAFSVRLYLLAYK